jgi:hypothetical protein
VSRYCKKKFLLLIMAYLKECFSRQLLRNKIVLNEMLKKLTSYIWYHAGNGWIGFMLKSLELNSEILYHFVVRKAIVPEQANTIIWAKTTQE